MQQAMKNKKRANNEDAAVVRCQRCLKYGHLTYECKNENVYLYGPSRTMQFNEKQLQYKLNSEKPPGVPDAFDGDWKRNAKRKVPLEVSSDSSNYEQVQVKKEGTTINVKKQRNSSFSESSNEDSSNSDSDSSASSYKRRQKKKKMNFMQLNNYQLMSSKKKNISKIDDGYDEVGYFCGWIKKKNSKNVNIEQSRLSVNKQTRNSLYKSVLDTSNQNCSSQLNQLNSTNTDSQRQISDASPFVSNFVVPSFENNYPQNQLFQLKNNQNGDTIFAKITSTKIEVSKSMLINEDIYNSQRISDQISKYIATRIKDQINSLAELGCGDGGNTVQFANYLDFVIAIDKSTEACLKTRKNCDKGNQNQDFPNPKVEIINSDIFKLKRRLPFDSIFINPTINSESAFICRDLLKDCQPNLQQLLMTISDQIENLIIQFPAQIDYSQLPLLLNINQQYQNNTQYKYQSLVTQQKQQSFIAHCSLEIEKIYVNGVHVQNIIYYGKIANISREELRSILTIQLQNQEVKPEAIQNVITKLKDKIGSLEVVYELLQAQSFKYNIDKFLEVVCDKYKLDYCDYGFILYQKLSKEFSQNTFNYQYKLRDSNNELQQSECAYSPKFSYNLNGLQIDDSDSVEENEEIEALGLSQDKKQNKLK